MAKKEQKTKVSKENNKNKKSFFKDFKAELKKVVWPTPKQLVNNTVAVITIVLITAVIVFVLDVAFESMNKYGVDKLKNVISNTSSEDNTTDSNSTSDENTTDGNTSSDESTTDVTTDEGSTSEENATTDESTTSEENTSTDENATENENQNTEETNTETSENTQDNTEETNNETVNE